MRVPNSVALASCVILMSNAAAAARDLAEGNLDTLLTQAQEATKRSLEAGKANGRINGWCTLETLSIRREWDALSGEERKAYTDAVTCLQQKSTQASLDFAPGARSRFDDWVATHIHQSLTIHYTGNFLGWHRWFIWLYEQALREECGYTGTQPYWNWAKTARTGLGNSLLFDGSEYSMGGNGEKVEQTGSVVLGGSGLPILALPTGSGGGCVVTGPFQNMTVNMGPAALSAPGNITIAGPNPLEYNPRCLKRDLTDWINQRFANETSVLHTIKQKTIMDFQMILQGVPGSGELGVHGGGHYALGGDPGRDIFASPGDPAFFLHHAAVDRTWWIWQAIDPLNRVYGKNAVDGTGTFLNNPPSPDTTLDTPIEMTSITNQVVSIRDVMSTTSGSFCYVYE